MLSAYMPGETTAFAFTGEKAERLRKKLPEVEITLAADEAGLLASLPEADAVAVWRFRPEWFAAAPKLKVVATPAAGRDYFQVEAPPGVELWYGGFHGPFMAETALGMMLACARGLLPARSQAERGAIWPRAAVGDAARLLRGAKVVVVGFGRIGAAVGRLASLVGARIIGVKRSASPRPEWMRADDRIVGSDVLDAELPDADHVVLTLPRAPDTDRLFDARRLALLPARAFLYNLGRGNAIDESALADACRCGRLAGACLDVTAAEPPPADAPVVGAANIWLLPHTSACAPEYMDYFVDEFAERWRARFPARPGMRSFFA